MGSTSIGLVVTFPSNAIGKFPFNLEHCGVIGVSPTTPPPKYAFGNVDINQQNISGFVTFTEYGLVGETTF